MDLYSGYGFGIDRNEKIEMGLDDEKKDRTRGWWEGKSVVNGGHTEGAEKKMEPE